MAPQFSVLALLCFSILTSAQSDAIFYNATTDFSLKLLKELSKSNDGNVLVSPSCVNVLLSVLQQGAQQRTAEQLNAVLGAKPDVTRDGFANLFKSIINDGNAAELKLGMKMYLNKGFSVGDKFRRNALANFHTEVQKLPLGSAAAPGVINQWVSNVTGGHINDIIQPGSLSADSLMVLVSAVFFTGKWLTPFTEVRPGVTFTKGNGETVQVPFLLESKRFPAGRRPKKYLKWVELPYQGGIFSMYLILPLQNYTLKDVLENLDGGLFRGILESNSTKRVSLFMPKFTLKQRTPIHTTLTNMGLTDMFSDAADLSGIAPPPLKVSSIFHEAFLDVNEVGSEAAAAAAAVINTLSLVWSPDDMNFRANRPFLLFIVDKPRKMILFAAKIDDPS